ncbi:MAG: hypothetical protein KTQ49_02945 [Candidatus Omnitrophica bacterium]|nr:hypothetical protein [Candidatus Omnitrophota bacterium]
MKEMIVASIVALGLVFSAGIAKSGLENLNKKSPVPAYSLYGYEGVVYRINQINGRIDALVPSSEAALLFPIGQVQLPRANDALTEEQKASLSQNIKTLSQYIQAERARSLGIKTESVAASKS